jgi:hypothetical protein
MVKTLPTVERSTQIRFGKHTQQDQGENTIVLNASNTAVDASNGGAVYVSPVRFDDTYQGKPEIVLMMYNTETKELTESGESAQDLIGNQGLQAVTNQGNVTSNSMIFYNNAVAFVTSGNVGISNALASHTLSVGSNLYVDETGSNVLVVAGSVSIAGDLTVNGGTTLIKTDNLVIRDPIIEIGQNNITNDTTLDLGLIMGRPGSNVVVGYRELSNEFVMAYTNSSASSNVITPIDSQDLNVHVYGGVLTESNVGVKTTSPDAELHVVGNVYVSSNLTVDTDTFHVDVEADRVGINTKNPTSNLHVVGNVYVSSNLTVDTDTFHVDVEADRVGINTKNPTSNLHVVGNVYVSSNTIMGGTLTINHPTTAILTDLNSNVEIKLNQLANVVLGEKALANEDILVYDGSNWVNQLQNHTFLTVKAGEAINKGEAVYASGSVDDNTFIVRKARANSSTTMPALGVAYQDFANNDQGLIVTFGQVSSLNTNNFLEGETVYVSNVTAGGVSNVQPYGTTDLIQNLGLVLKQDVSDGIISVTGAGRANDIPNAQVVQDESDINWVYVSNVNNDFKKIEPSNLLTQLQTFEQVSSAGNVVSNIISFTNARTGLTVSSNLHVGSNISVTGLSDPNNQYLPMVKTDGFLVQSPVYVTSGGKYVIAASELEFLGNITLGGNTTIIASNSVTIEDRIFGIGANNSTSGLDSGIIIEHQEDGAFANVALIFHPDDHSFSIGYTQNTYTDDHILDFTDATHILRIRLRGNVEVQNNITVTETLNVTGATTFGDDFTVGGASNLFVDVSTSRVGINEASPTVPLDVGGDVRVQGTTTSSAKGNGALVVAGGVGITGPLFGAAATLDGVTTITNDTTSDAKGNGALVVAGGVGITGPLFGAAATFDGDVSGLEGIFSDDLTVGAASNLFVDVSLSRVGINTATPEAGLHVSGNAYVSSTTDSTTTTTGALIVSGGIGVAKKIVGQHASFEDVTADSVTASGMVKGATISGTNVYGTLAGANTAAVTTLTASGMVKGATISGTNVYGTLAGANTAAVTTLTASGMVKGATISGTNVYGTLAGANTAAVTTLTASGMVKGTTITGTNLYGTLAGANTATVTDLTASAMVKGVTLTGTNLYGTLAGANTAAVTDLTASAMVKGTTITGTNLYGTLTGANTATVTDLTASAMVKGVTLTGTNLYGTLAGANTAAVTDLTASAMVKGVTLTGTNLYGTLVGANTAAVTDLTASGMVKGATISGTNVYGTLAGANTAAVTTLTASGMVKGATISGTNVYGTLAGSNAATITTLNASGVVTLTDTTAALSTTTGALKVAGGISTQANLYSGSNVFITGGLITNTGGVGKKTYSYSADLANDADIANSTYVLDFTNHAFHAKVTAMLIESADEISTMIFDVIGGIIGGGSNSAYVPALGQVSVINTSTMSTQWDPAIATALAGTTVTIKPGTTCTGTVRFNIFVEYLSHETAGRLTSITNSGSSAGTGDFGY